jgi:hypothetical protein
VGRPFYFCPGIDYRLVGSTSGEGTYFVRGDGDADDGEGGSDQELQQLWLRLTKGGQSVTPTTLVIEGQGRSVEVPQA